MARTRSDNLDLMVKRKRLGLSQDDLAQELGTVQPVISAFERLNAPLPEGRSREDYIAALDKLAAEGARK